MTQTAIGLYNFFSGFGIPAYVRRNIPYEAEMPYITYELEDTEPLKKTLIHAWVWYRNTSFVEICAKCDEIKAAIGTGVSIPTDSGFLLLFMDADAPFIQFMDDPNPDVKCAYLSMILHANTI